VFTAASLDGSSATTLILAHLVDERE